MENRIWFITGVSGGFGKAIAEEALSFGHIVIGSVRKQEQLAQFTALHDKNAYAVLLDVTDGSAVASTVAQIINKHGRIDVLVNNAGYGLIGAIEEVSMKEAREQLETNVFGALQVTKEVLPFMRKQQYGRIIQLSSAAGFRSTGGFGIYNASKFALEGFSEALAQEVAPFEIKVIIVEPGPFRTQFAGISIIESAHQIDAYSLTAGAFRERLNAINGQQDGDPKKGAKIIVMAAASDHPPLRLPLGKGAIQAIRTKLNAVEQDIALWENYTAETSF